MAGKGHETYQEIKGERRDFNDLKLAQEMLNQKYPS
ncbi:MAG: UDP-N-acetylmuramoyl-L-alanyl-D-glutamate--2,6-diaminopimelate ligase [Roseivirga sp.]